MKVRLFGRRFNELMASLACCHGPTQWKWWQLFSVSIVRANRRIPTWEFAHWIVWFYTRSEKTCEPRPYWPHTHRNAGRSFEVVFDRRKVAA